MSQGIRKCDQIFKLLKEGHSRFLRNESIHPHGSKDRLTQLADSQTPTAAIVGCADSRVPIELLFDAGFGDLFVIRSAGNTIFSEAIGSMEYAVEHLGVSLIIVLGHGRCGALPRH